MASCWRADVKAQQTEAEKLIERIQAFESCLVETRTTDLPIAELIEKLEQGERLAKLNPTEFIH